MPKKAKGPGTQKVEPRTACIPSWRTPSPNGESHRSRSGSHMKNHMKKTNKTRRFPVYRLELVKDSEARYENVTCALDVVRRMKAFANSDRENVVCLLLDARNRVVGQQVISIGTLTASLVHPREVFKAAILRNAASIILAHNHPSGEIEPSEADLELTRRIADAGRLLGINLADHVILAPDGRYRSCAPPTLYANSEQPRQIANGRFPGNYLPYLNG